MIIPIIYRTDLVVNSYATAKEFLSCVKACFTIPYNDEYVIRVEPGNFVTILSKHSIKNGYAAFVPSICDSDGVIIYRYRKYINAYLRRG